MPSSASSALARVALVHDLRVDDLVVSGCPGAVGGRAGRSGGLLRLGLLVDGGAHLLADLRGPLGCRLDGLGVVALQRLLHVGDRGPDLGLDVLGHLVFVLAEELLGAVDQGVGLVADLGLLTAPAVLLGVLLRLADHLLDVSFGSAEPPVICTDCCLPVPRSLAETLTMPLASMSKVTSICGTPRGAGAMPASSNMPSFLLYAAISRSPWKTWICT